MLIFTLNPHQISVVMSPLLHRFSEQYAHICLKWRNLFENLLPMSAVIRKEGKKFRSFKAFL